MIYVLDAIRLGCLIVIVTIIVCALRDIVREKKGRPK